MERQTIVSGQIKSFGYEPESKTLEIEFTSGLVYQYLMVDQACYDDFLAAESKGKFLNAFIKPHFGFVKVEAEKKKEEEKNDSSNDATN